MQKLLVTNGFINAEKADEPKLRTNFVKGFAAILFYAFLTVNPHQKVMASPAEHQAVLNLVPADEANRQVVQSGSWSNIATWGGDLPADGDDIYVPEGKTLVVDVASDINLGTIRVDGTLKFATSVNVKLKLDTLVVTPTGTFEVGSEYGRVPNSRKIEIIIANNGPINRVWDPSNISRGVILQGKTRIYGSNKSAYHKLSVDPAAGSTQITLADTPIGWIKGDIIAITATKFRAKKTTDTGYQTEDELRRIKAIDGRTVTLASVANSDIVEPLQYSHVPTIANMPVYAANLTRNVVFSGEGGDNVPASQRGHFMVMHAPNTIIKGAGFYHLGRTNKAIPLDDFMLENKDEKKFIVMRLVDAQGNYIKGPNNNPRGRYAVHFHHTGINPSAQPVICSGNAVMSSLGWGFVNHSSNVLMQNNASYNVLGSHFVTEDGNELGTFRHNIAIKSSGRVDSGIFTGIKTGVGNHDHGHSAHGFWFQGRNLTVEDNVVSGTYGSGMIFYNRNEVKGIDTQIAKENLIGNDQSLAKNLPYIHFFNVPLGRVKNLTVLASDSALMVIKSNHNQGHDARNTIESVKGYSLLRGVNIEYASKYTLKDFDLVADPASDAYRYGINISRSMRDVVVANSSVQGFAHPILTGFTFNNAPDPTDAVFANVTINGKPMAASDIHKPDTGPAVQVNYDPAFQDILEHMPATAGILGFTPDNIMSYNLPTVLASGFKVKGTVSDTFGSKAFESTWGGGSLVTIMKQGYYTRPDGSMFIVLNETVYDRLTGQHVPISTRANIVKNYGGWIGPHLGVVTD